MFRIISARYVFSKKTLLGTGCAGSFGNTGQHRIPNAKIKEICVFSRDEKKPGYIHIDLNSSNVKFTSVISGTM